MPRVDKELDKQKKREYYAKNKQAWVDRAEQKKKADPKKWHENDRKWAVKYKFGLEWEKFLSMVEANQGCCYICKEFLGISLNVDHCHSTGRVRGLLCPNCNRAIGLLKDNPDIIYKAGKYLEEFSREKSDGNF